MNTFPVIQLPYERFIHKEVHEPDCIYLAQPVGKRCYAWFTYKEQPRCYIIDKNCYSISIQFDESLRDTIVYGTIVNYGIHKYFIVDNIFYYKGEKCTCNYSEKLTLMSCVFQKVQHYNSQWLFMFPEMAMHMKTFHTAYKVYCIKIIQLNGSKIFNYIEKKEVFTVHATLKTDVYELHNSSGFNSIAYIDTYVRSVYIKSLFQTLDSLIKMECTWNEPFKKWIPVNIHV